MNVAPPKTAAQGLPQAQAAAAWGRVLAAHVDEHGRIDFAGIAKAPADLDAYVAWIAAVDPENSPGSFPTPESRMAYYLNAYNALAMYNVIQSGIPESLGSMKVRFFYRDRLVMGGRRISLYRLENAIVRPLGDPRIHFALNCMVRGCPRLPRVPFEAARLNEQLDEAARLFFSEGRNVRRVPDEQAVYFNEILRFYTKDFLAKATTLTAYANLYAASPIPEGWKVRFTPYDWTVNKQ